jgi:hypothetical protein
MPAWTQYISSWFSSKPSSTTTFSPNKQPLLSKSSSATSTSSTSTKPTTTTSIIPQQPKLLSSYVKLSSTEEVPTIASVSSEKIMGKKMELESLFESLHKHELQSITDPTDGEEPENDVIGLTGILHLGKLLKMDISSDLCLLIGFFKLGVQATGAWKINIQQFVLFSNHGVGTVEEMNVLLKQWASDLKKNQKEFSKFYEWLFSYLNDGKTTMGK